MTEREYLDLCQRSGAISQAPEDKRVGHPKPIRPEPVSGPLSVSLVLHGHCPSKKNLWTPNATGGFRLMPEVKDQIEVLTTQALFHWKQTGPVEHPDITVTFFVHHARRDRDGMFVTILDCLQEAGVLVNDNLKWNNGRTILEPCVFVEPKDERVEILIEKPAERPGGEAK